MQSPHHENSYRTRAADEDAARRTPGPHAPRRAQLAVLALLPLCLGGCAGTVGNWVIGILAGIFGLIGIVFMGIALDDKKAMGCAALPGLICVALVGWLLSRLGVFAAIGQSLGSAGDLLFSVTGLLFGVAIVCFLLVGFGGFWLSGKKFARLGLLVLGAAALVGGLAYQPLRRGMIEQEFPAAVRSRLESSNKVLTQLEARVEELKAALRDIRSAREKPQTGERTRAKLQELEKRYEKLLEEAQAARDELRDMKDALYYEARYGGAAGIDEDRVERLSSKLESADEFLQRSNQEIQETDL